MFLAAAILLIWGAAAPLSAKMVVLPVNHVSEAEILPLAERLLSPEGKVSFDRRTHSLIVVDTPEGVSRIQQLVRRVDLRPEPLLLRLRARRPQTQEDARGVVRGRVSGPGWSAGTGTPSPDGVDMRLDARRLTEDGTGEQIIRVHSGRPAYFAIGVLMPESSQLATICGGSVNCRRVASYPRVESGVDVTLARRGSQAVLRMTPRLSGGTGSEKGRVRFSEASMEIRIPMGQWVDIGALVSERSKALGAVLTRAGTAEQAQGELWVRVDPNP